MIKNTVLDVYDLSNSQSSTVWCVYHLQEDGTKFNYAFPAISLSNHAAEYGIDPVDVDTMLDVVIYQFHMSGMNDFHPDHPTFVWNTDEDTAREHHLARVEKLKKEIEILDPYNKLEIIKRHHLENFDVVKHREYRDLCQSIREHKKRGLMKNGIIQ